MSRKLAQISRYPLEVQIIEKQVLHYVQEDNIS